MSASLKSSPGRRAKSSARSEGCAVISSTIAAISPTRHSFTLLPPPIGSLFLCLHRLRLLISRESSTTQTNTCVTTAKQVRSPKLKVDRRMVSSQTGRNGAEKKKEGRTYHIRHVMRAFLLDNKENVHHIHARKQTKKKNTNPTNPTSPPKPG